MYSINGEAIRCSGLRPLLGSYPLLGGSVIGGFTVSSFDLCNVDTVGVADVCLSAASTKSDSSHDSWGLIHQNAFYCFVSACCRGSCKILCTSHISW